MTLLALQGIRKEYDRRPVLRGIDLTLVGGERVNVVGDNGSGKTTLLRIAATVTRPTEGVVRVAGNTGRAGRRHLGFVGQAPGLWPDMDAATHLRWAARMHGHALDRGAAMTALADAGLAHATHLPAASLSRGQQQRVAFLRALVARPRVLVLDEPRAPLDAAGIDWLGDHLDGFEGAILSASPHKERGARTMTLRGGVLQ